MKIQCDACEVADANLLCCVEERALCWICDEMVHSANKLAGQHQRVQLISTAAAGTSSSSSNMPKCDICKEGLGYFFCLQDRALFCRTCDFSVHTMNTHVALHQRFLFTGIQVGLKPAEPVSSLVEELSNVAIIPEPSSTLVSAPPMPTNIPMPSSNLTIAMNAPPLTSTTSTHNFVATAVDNPSIFPNQVVFNNGGTVAGEMPPPAFQFPGTTMPDWPLDEFLRFPDFAQNFGGYKDNNAHNGSYEGVNFMCSANEGFVTGESSSQVPQFPLQVWSNPPPPPPTFSGLNCQENTTLSFVYEFFFP